MKLTKAQLEMLRLLCGWSTGIGRSCLNGASVPMMDRMAAAGLVKQSYDLGLSNNGNYCITQAGRDAVKAARRAHSSTSSTGKTDAA